MRSIPSLEASRSVPIPRLEWSFCFRNVIVRDSDAEAHDEAIRRIQMLHTSVDQVSLHR